MGGEARDEDLDAGGEEGLNLRDFRSRFYGLRWKRQGGVIDNPKISKGVLVGMIHGERDV
jgi:hypothetical protein